MQVLWHFRKDLRCARVIDSDLDTEQLAKQVLDLFLLSNEQHAEHDQKTVLLLLDTNDELPADSATVVRSKDDVKLLMKLSTEERKRFDQKKEELKKKYKKMSQKFLAFNIMQGGFQKEDAEKLITQEMVNHIEKDTKSSSTRLLSFLALINSYVPGSHLSKLVCEEFIDPTKQPSDEKNPKLETIMKPFEDLIVIFSEGEQEDRCVRLAHPMIADACLNMFTEHKLTRSDIALDFLNSMVKGKESNYGQICKKIFITRLETGQGKELKGKKKFSTLILDIMHESGNNNNQCIHLLEMAANLFSTDPYYLQTLARFYYIKVKEDNKYEMAETWAEEAINRDPKKSDIRDTLGQVHKHHLQSKKKTLDVKECLAITKTAIDAFKDEEKAAEVESEENTTFNNRGCFGFLQVCNVIHEMRPNPKNPLEQEHSDYISGLRGDVESRYDFFEWYLAFSRPSLNTEEPDYFHEDVEECYKKYFTQGEQTDETTLNEKKMKSFGGLLHFLKSDTNVLKEHQSALKHLQSDNETQTVLYILANIVLSQSGEQCEQAEDLQARLQKLWLREIQDRSPEFYLLILLLFWPDETQPGITNPPNLEKCLKKMHHSYKEKYQKYLRRRYLVPLFFFGKGTGLQRLVHALKLDQIDLELLTEGHGHADVECLQRINGEVKNQEVFAVRDGQQIPVTPHNPSSVCKPGQVSFYLGFTIRGPVAYNIRYEENLTLQRSHVNRVI
ncbi:sterile alpha motif domain-containing protein 9-like [Sinocyclocheilus rhinocerous]|uniref:sterile alpha motif domain-containing protein 9-like n=1 Tax=Sinocyclocheilus rhinocerous TaxID=307959 RepID=UPI0007B9037B|nr:PREDICTED: sterile alpha motif domain-containing protein 9-like [Sinocyclocheilus rhinocerous]